ncbi:hypothetical protein OV079_16295 [Nannocystis pusilla]|uniref:Uncharacterized protein n=1 Tax=Nannocystis pusilla TaxID=889268 RepID=A0A9X3EPM7_9BACT|nr:hypothetical protein [Nannocystis pusilla]MCY1007089.1 hypothetical protein [Nannocystis pusilla]
MGVDLLELGLLIAEARPRLLERAGLLLELLVLHPQLFLLGLQLLGLALGLLEQGGEPLLLLGAADRERDGLADPLEQRRTRGSAGRKKPSSSTATVTPSTRAGRTSTWAGKRSLVPVRRGSSAASRSSTTWPPAAARPMTPSPAAKVSGPATRESSARPIRRTQSPPSRTKKAPTSAPA